MNSSWNKNTKEVRVLVHRSTSVFREPLCFKVCTSSSRSPVGQVRLAFSCFSYSWRIIRRCAKESRNRATSGSMVFAQHCLISCLFDGRLHVNFCISLDHVHLEKETRLIIWHQPNQWTIIREIPQSYHTFALEMIPPKWVPFNDPRKKTTKNLNSLVVEPTPLINMLVKMGSSSPIFGGKIKNYLGCHHLELLSFFLQWPQSSFKKIISRKPTGQTSGPIEWPPKKTNKKTSRKKTVKLLGLEVGHQSSGSLP